MDRKSIIVLILSFGLLMLWLPLVNKIFPPTKLPPGTNELTQATNLTTPGAATAEAPAPSTNREATPATPVTPAAAPPVIRSDEPEKLVTIENENVRYIFSSHQGGLKFVELKKYK